ncbi:MAG: hypothetical protein HXS42_15740 [Theionarchaea archaeon]|nr:hypothetical protein [Theionarchaea archaeon]
MYFSRFNYVSDYEKDGQRLLMNFLSQSCDIVDEESASHFSQEKDVSTEEREYALQRGYIFQDEAEELILLQKLYHYELQNKRVLSVVLLDTFDGKGLREVLKDMKNRNSQCVLFTEHPLDDSLPFDHFDNLLTLHIVTTHENLRAFEPFFMKNMVSKVSLLLPLSGSILFAEEVESRVDTLVESGTLVEIIPRVQENEVELLRPLMKYFIYKGWPFLENFTCSLEPNPNEGCIFGRWYGTENLVRRIFREYAAYPQTEFCSIKNWVGVNPIHSLIWTGKPSPPSFNFCEASKGLTALKRWCEVPCPYLDSGKFEAENPSDCQVCTFALTCGGGCRLKSTQKAERCPPVKELIEASLEYYFDEFLQRITFGEQYHGGIQ